MTSGVTAVPGFVAGGARARVSNRRAIPTSRSSRPTTGRRSTAAGVFTTNLAQAAPVQVSRRHLANGRAAAVVFSSGNAQRGDG